MERNKACWHKGIFQGKLSEHTNGISFDKQRGYIVGIRQIHHRQQNRLDYAKLAQTKYFRQIFQSEPVAQNGFPFRNTNADIPQIKIIIYLKTM